MPWLLRLGFRLPNFVYRIGLGWMLGRRFLAVTHRGRRSGRTRTTVLEVIHVDETTDESIVVSAYGSGADWYRNIIANPAIEVRTGRLRYRPALRTLAPEEAAGVVAAFVTRHPVEASFVPWVFAAIGALDQDEVGMEPAAVLRR
ncbi:MAG: nitroreductase family deazaflavin-dependent oxidoreductase, partial [Acidimicrobiia bacterium]